MNPGHPHLAPGGASGPAEIFYAGALTRIRNLMLILGPVATVAAACRFGLRAAAGFAVGGILAYLNFRWLNGVVSGLADRVTQAGKPQSAKGILTRFLLRYALLGAAAYAILTSFPASLGGLFAGLFLPVGAIVCEAAYELYAGVVHRM